MCASLHSAFVNRIRGNDLNGCWFHCYLYSCNSVTVSGGIRCIVKGFVLIWHHHFGFHARDRSTCCCVMKWLKFNCGLNSEKIKKLNKKRRFLERLWKLGIFFLRFCSPRSRWSLHLFRGRPITSFPFGHPPPFFSSILIISIIVHICLMLFFLYPPKSPTSFKSFISLH